jgi:FeS assembly SUF system regulator
MIRISKMADYAVVTLAAMAHSSQDISSAAQIAQESKLPEPTVSKVLKYVAKAGIVHATRGTKGGYVLARPPEDISIMDIIIAVDGPLAITACAGDRVANCGLTGTCSLHGRWDPVNEALRDVLARISLADMCINTKKNTCMTSLEFAHGRN